jgi:RTA1 like protein
LRKGGFLEVIGFAARIWETSNNQNEAGYIIYLVPVLVAPTILAAADYSLTSIM